MLLDAFRNCNLGVSIQYRMDGGIFNLHLNSTSKVMELPARDLLYAVDCALAAHCLELKLEHTALLKQQPALD